MSRLVEIYGSDEMRRFGESDFPLLIGSDESAHIHLPGIASVAAHVGDSRGHLFLQPAAAGHDADPVYHNDEHMQSSVWLKSGDITRIAEWVISWQHAGDRLEARVGKGPQPVLTPPGDHAEPLHAETQSKKLPRVSKDQGKPHKSGLRNLLASLFVLLLLCAGFILLAKPLEVLIMPEPDRLSVSGFPPAFGWADRFVGLPGTYTVHAEKTGYHLLKKQVEIGGSSAGKYQFDLEKLPGLLHITSSPPGVTVSVDGVKGGGSTPVAGLEIAAGSHVLRFEHPRYFSVEKTVEIEGRGEKQSLVVTLEPAWAEVTISSQPAGAEVFIDDRQMGLTPLELELVHGTHALLMQKEKFTDFDRDFAVQAGVDLILPTFALTPSPATVVLSSKPHGASISVDSLFMGRTPLTLSLSSKESHEIDLVAAGFKPKRKSVTLQPEEERQINLTLEEEFGTIFLSTTPANATVYVDGKKYGQATGKLRLATRPHKIEVRAKGYDSAVQTITPQSGFSQRIEIGLSRPKKRADHSEKATLEQTIETAAGQRMILITPTSFTMGASRQEPGRRANEREHQVQLKRPYYVSIKEVTNAEFRLFDVQHSSGSVGNRSLENDSQPVVNVSWDDAARYVNWLSKKDGLTPFYREENGKMVSAAGKGKGYRLPTEAEWAFVSRMAGRQDPARYPWQGSFPPVKNSGNFADESALHLLPLIIDGYTDSYPATAPTGSFGPNPVGLFDIGGNAAEWCHDYYAVYTGMISQAKVDPMGPETGSHHLVRGSSWRDAGITELRLSYRRYSREPASDIGFRIVRYAK